MSGTPSTARRRRLLLWSAPGVVLLLAIALKLFLTAFFSSQGTSNYYDGHYRSAGDSFAHLGVANVYERWIAPFNHGDALYRAQSYAAAEKQFAAALPLAPASQKCRVRGNLALAGEQVGNQAVKAKNRNAAITAYTRALHNATVGNCPSLAARRAELRKILDLLKRKRTLAPPPPSGSSSASSSPASGNPADRLKQRNLRVQRAQNDDDNANAPERTPNPNGKAW